MPELPPAIDQSGARLIDQLTGVGVGFTVICIMFGFSLFGNYIQFMRNKELVDQLLKILPDTVASVLKAVSDFKEALNEFIEKKT